MSCGYDLVVMSSRGHKMHISHFYPTALKGCQGIVFTNGVRMGGRQKKVCPGYISETVRCRKLILGKDTG